MFWFGDRVEQCGSGGVSRGGAGDGVSVLLQQWADPDPGVADGAPAHLEQFGHGIPAAHLAQAEDDRQDALRVGDLLVEDAAAGSGLTVAAALAVLAPLGFGGLSPGQSFDQFRQVPAAHPGQRRVS